MLSKLRFSNKKAADKGGKKPQRLWREPLIHFFVLGLAVFGLHAALDRQPKANFNDPYLVEISSADIEWMRTLFNKQMGREPTGQDLRGQVNQLIREQILSREAVSMGLDEGDIVVRRRLAQKMAFLFKDLSAMNAPTEDELRQYYKENLAQYEISPQITFTHVYFNRDNRGVDGAKQAIQALVKENVDPNTVEALGDPSMLSTGCNNCRGREIKDRFGNEFAGTIEDLKPGAWYGPIASAYGLHAVYIYDRQDGKLPAFDEIVDQVRNDWMFANQEENTRKVYEEIRSRYQVLVEGLPYDSDV